MNYFLVLCTRRGNKFLFYFNHGGFICSFILFSNIQFGIQVFSLNWQLFMHFYLWSFSLLQEWKQCTSNHIITCTLFWICKSNQFWPFTRRGTSVHGDLIFRRGFLPCGKSDGSIILVPTRGIHFYCSLTFCAPSIA